MGKVGESLAPVTEALCDIVDETILAKLNAAVDKMKPGGAILPVILVGGGAALVPGDNLAGCPGRVLRPFKRPSPTKATA